LFAGLSLEAPANTKGFMKRTLPTDSLQEIATKLAHAHKAFQRRYPGSSAERQPVHVVYGGAHLFRSGTTRRLGDLALKSLDEYAADFVTFAKALGLEDSGRLPSDAGTMATIAKSLEDDAQAVRRENPAAWLAHTIYRRVRDKLKREPIEDFRLDFEDGYGNRSDEEEDGHAASAAAEVVAGMNAGELPPFIGIRVKPFTEELRDRSIRTLDIFLTALSEKSRGELPNHFCITLPKVALPDEVAALADICSSLEPMLDFDPGALKIEVMVETSQAIFNERGEANLLQLVSAARGRCVAAHFGPFDYTSSLGISAPRRAGTHPASDFARQVMQVALADTGIRIADGPLNVLPIPPHRAAKDGAALTARQQEENRSTVHLGWRLEFEHVRRALENGFYQGWDLHPAQLPARFAAVYSYFLENLDSSAERLRNFLEKAAQATRIGHVFDDAAMVQGLLNYFLQAIHCGALTPDEAHALTGLTPEELRIGSFTQILARRS
jgi:citrate lyase beta subunit